MVLAPCATMSPARIYSSREIRRVLLGGTPLDERTATGLWSAILDEALDGVELGAVLAAMALRGESREELAGLHRAVMQRMPAWVPPMRDGIICIPAYGRVPGESLLVGLTTALLRRFEVPVLVHGVLDSSCGDSAARLLRELGVLPCGSLAQADEQLTATGAAFVPAQLICPAFAALLAMRARLGIDNAAHAIAQSIDPTRGLCTRITFHRASEAERDIGALAGSDEVALTWTGALTAESISVRPRIEHLHASGRRLLFEADLHECRTSFVAPAADVPSRARWIERVASGAAPVPVPSLNLAAACLYAIGRAPDLFQAKAIAAVNAGRLAA